MCGGRYYRDLLGCHFAICTYIKLSYCTSETNMMFYVNYISICFFKNRRMAGGEAQLGCTQEQFETGRNGHSDPLSLRQ